MRALFIPLFLLTAACRQQSEPEQPANARVEGTVSVLGSELQTFRGEGKDRLCIGGTSAPAAVITYAADGKANCSARGRIEGSADKLFFVPEEDNSCRIEVRRDGDKRLTLAAPTPGCAYYCGPGASLEGRTFDRMDKPEPVVDLAGDPLC